MYGDAQLAPNAGLVRTDNRFSRADKWRLHCLSAQHTPDGTLEGGAPQQLLGLDGPCQPHGSHFRRGSLFISIRLERRDFATGNSLRAVPCWFSNLENPSYQRYKLSVTLKHFGAPS